jgi:hypothetical protein
MEAPNKIWLDQSVSDPDELCLYCFTENPSQKSIEYIRAGKVLESLATLTSEREELRAELSATRTALGVDKEAMKQGIFQAEGEIDVLKSELDALKGEVEKAFEAGVGFACVSSEWSPEEKREAFVTFLKSKEGK